LRLRVLVLVLEGGGPREREEEYVGKGEERVAYSRRYTRGA
jgi:hypothetical protein